MTQYVLAGDIGGTKTVLALYAVEPPRRMSLVREAVFASQRYGGLAEVIREFLAVGTEQVAAGAFGIAGPVRNGVVVTTNLPWRVEAAHLAQVMGGARVRLLNDLEATAYGALFLSPQEILTLNAGKPQQGNRAVIAAGTGLGQAFLFWDGTRYWPAATEGGHADFAPRDEKEAELLRFLREEYAHVSYERVLSGPGLVNIFRFLTEALGKPVSPAVQDRLRSEDPAAVIGEAGVAGTCATCAEAVEMFLGFYGAQAGNLALTVMGVAGVYVGGGIIVKLLPKVTAGTFMRAFLAKGRFTDFMADIPVYVLLNPKTSQIGAAHVACELLA
ncbi:MAG: glucokinase [Candidatus Binatia bacterium]|nr:glucokinase [Candidatus Binatia bacterium]